ncbi:hypothetical protein [Streptomyces sp. NBC_00557]|uniref:hypothetical protein n=1 Tax=Streptomyces sp. NBC_00557 TaxID=2975776 RepID=UPI002E81702B|nr:hypothetical protein [Streptomyces sp. NBC_00557]WUC39366.1 hypothetical protein OG956_36725 [Streptomyces sp. NBC_00557]
MRAAEGLRRRLSHGQARSGSERPYAEDDLALVEDLAHRVALHVDNARLHTEVQATAEHPQRLLLPQPDHLQSAVAGQDVDGGGTTGLGCWLAARLR